MTSRKPEEEKPTQPWENVLRSQYTADQRRDVVVTWLAYGQLAKVSELTGVPKETVRDWRHQAWWDPLVRDISERMGSEFDQKLTAIISQVADQIIDRLENGDIHILRDGRQVRAPISARELSILMNTTFNTKRVLNNLPTKITANDKHLKALEEKFRALGAKNISKEVIEAEEEADAA